MPSTALLAGELPASDAPQALRRRLCFWLSQVLGCSIFIAGLWQTVLVLLDFVPYYYAPLAWAYLLANVPAIFLCCRSGVDLVHGRTSAYFWLYLAAAFAVIQWLARLYGWHYGEPAFDAPLVMPLNPLQPIFFVYLLLLIVSNIGNRIPSSPPALVTGESFLTRRRLGRLAIIIAFVGVVMAYTWTMRSISRSAGRQVTEGIRAYDKDNVTEAMELWQNVVDWYPFTPSWAAALNNCGYANLEQGHYADAIPYFARLLRTRLDDRAPNGVVMLCKNYHHNACVNLSTCHEKLGNRKLALEFAYRARDEYPFQTWSLTDLMYYGPELQQRIDRLEGQACK